MSEDEPYILVRQIAMVSMILILKVMRGEHEVGIDRDPESVSVESISLSRPFCSLSSMSTSRQWPTAIQPV